MADANYHKPPNWDRIYRKDRDRIAFAQQNAEVPYVYACDYLETAKFLKSDRKLRKAMERETKRLHRNILRQIPTDGESGESRVGRALNTRFIREGGRDKDRMEYRLWVKGTDNLNDPGSRFLAAERMSQFTKEAWEERSQGKVVVSTRKGWIRKGLEDSSVKKGKLSKMARHPRLSAKDPAAIREQQRQNLRKGRG